MASGPSPKGIYKRLFPETQTPILAVDEPKLEKLGAAMTDENGESHDSSNLFAGYTYFGQFIDHNLTWNRSVLDAPQDEQVSGPNFRTASLDLDHVYGGGPEIAEALYEGEQGAERFRIGATLPSTRFNLPGGTLRDLPSVNEGVQVGDQADFRNTENAFVRQLHVSLLKFHNIAVQQLEQNQVNGDLPEGSSVFERARRLVIWSYQWLVWNDFLANIIDPLTWRPPQRRALGSQASAFQLPLEFALAAFRFGHSMVRSVYPMNCHRPAEPLLNVINPRKESAEPLREDDLVEWGRFFPGLPNSSRAVTHARSIDVHIATVLHQLPIETFQLFTAAKRDSEIVDLPTRTLLRGARARLASGQEVAAAMGMNGLTRQDFESDETKAGQALKDADLTHNTPLWYYILKEAQLRGHGDHLGPIGSQIVRDTIEGTLQNDNESYLVEQGPDWKPPEWLFPDGKRQAIHWMSRLILLVGDSQLPQGCQLRT
jgi:hypothetical protein